MAVSKSAERTESVNESKLEEKTDIIRELCDNIFPNRNLKSNHKLLVHTVKTKFIMTIVD